MKITAIDSFTVPLTEAAPSDYQMTALDLTRIRTDEGLIGYGFGRTDEAVLRDRIRPHLMGKDPAAINEWTAAHVLDGTSAVEHALWDVLGKAAGMPVHRLFGSARDRMPYYLTCVWPGAADQSHLTPEMQAEDLAHYVRQGHSRFKIRAWRRDPLEDVQVYSRLRQAIGTMSVELMLDRTAHHPGWLWTEAQALAVAEALAAVGGPGWKSPLPVTRSQPIEDCENLCHCRLPGENLARRLRTFATTWSAKPSISCSLMRMAVGAYWRVAKWLPWRRPSRCPVFCTAPWGRISRRPCKSPLRSQVVE